MATGELGRIGNADYVAAGVSVYVGVDADEGELAQLDTCLLAYFAAAGFLHCLANFDKTTRQRMAPDTWGDACGGSEAHAR